MSFFKFSSIRKLVHVKKTCKSFVEAFRSKSQRIKVHKVAKTVTTFLVSSRQKMRFRPTRQSSTTGRHYHLLQKGFPAIFIDELYVPKSSGPSRDSTTSKDKGPYVTSIGASASGRNIETNVATKHVLLLCEENKEKRINRDKLWRRDIRGVDERAEDFISKVREDMKLQREQSILDFQEMLARSV